MAQNVMEAIRLQSEDLKEELRELEIWENEMEKKKNGLSGNSVGRSSELEPPIRGSVPSLKKAMEEKKKTSPAVPDQTQTAKEKGNEFFRLNRIGDAIEAYTTGIEVDPNNSQCYVLYANRAMCYLRQERWALAEKDATTSAAMNSAYPKAYFRRAMARKNLGNLKEARLDLEAVLALAPTDDSAKSELAAVTEMIQRERAKLALNTSATGAPPKRIVIQEVDDEDDEEEDDALIKVDEEARREQQAALQRRAEEADAARQRLAEKENKARASTLRKSDRVEIVEEVDEEGSTEVQKSPIISSSSPSASSTTVPPPTSNTAKKECAPQPPAARKLPRSSVSKESLQPPKSYTELERVFTSVQGDKELRMHYVSLINPTGLRSLLGSNLTPELLEGLVDSVCDFPSEKAFAFLKGLSEVNRIEDITLFFDTDEAQRMKKAIDHASEGTKSTADLEAVKRKLCPA